MKNNIKKIARNFRLSPKINEELKERSLLTGATETRILEDALKLWFERGQQEQMKQLASKLGRSNKKVVRDAGIEPATLTVSKDTSQSIRKKLLDKYDSASVQNYSPSQVSLLPPSIAGEVLKGIQIANTLPKLPSLSGERSCLRRQNRKDNR